MVRWSQKKCKKSPTTYWSVCLLNYYYWSIPSQSLWLRHKLVSELPAVNEKTETDSWPSFKDYSVCPGVFMCLFLVEDAKISLKCCFSRRWEGGITNLVQRTRVFKWDFLYSLNGTLCGPTAPFCWPLENTLKNRWTNWDSRVSLLNIIILAAF